MGTKSRMYCVYKKVEELTREEIKEKYNSINAFSVEDTIFIEVLNIK